MHLRRAAALGSSLAVLTGALVTAPAWAGAVETAPAESAPELVLSIDRPVADLDDEQGPIAISPGSRFAIVIDSYVTETASTEIEGAANVSLRLPVGLIFRGANSMGPIGSAEWSCAEQNLGVECASDGATPASLIIVLEAGQRAEIDARASLEITLERAGSTAEESVPVAIVTDPVPRIHARSLDALPAGQRATAAVGAVVMSPLSDADPTIQLSQLAPPQATQVRVSGESLDCDSVSAECRSTRLLEVGEPLIAGASFVLDESQPFASWAARASVSDAGADVTVDVPLTAVRPAEATDRFVVTWRSPEGQSVVQGGAVALTARVTNVSDAPQRGSVVISLPSGVDLESSDRRWSCRMLDADGARSAVCRGPQLASGASSDLDLQVSASTTRRTGFVTLQASGGGSQSVADLAVKVMDPGDPVASASVWVKPRLRWQPWVDGSIRDVPVGQTDQWRLVVANIGGDELARGRTVTIRQRFASDVVVEPREHSAASCDVDNSVLTCVLRARTDVEPGGRIGAVTVNLTPTEADSPIVEGPLRARVTQARRGATATVVSARSIVPVIPLTLRANLPGGATRSGAAALDLTVSRTGTENLRGVRIEGLLPEGVTLEQPARSRFLSCRPVDDRVVCRVTRDLPGEGRTRSIRLPLAISPTAPLGPTTIEWRADHSRLTIAGLARTALTIRPQATLAAVAHPSLLVVGAGSGSERTVTLAAGLENPGSTSWDVAWQQDCVDGNGNTSGCRGISTERMPLNFANHHRASALIDTTKPGTYRFTVTATDGSASVSDTIEVRVVEPRAATSTMTSFGPPQRPLADRPPTPPVRLLSPAVAAPDVSISGAPLIVDDTGASVTLSASSTTSGATFTWRQIAGPRVTLSAQGSTASFTAPDTSTSLAFAVDVAGPNGATTTGVVSVAIAPPASSGFCSAVSAIQAAQQGSPVDLGSVKATFGSVTVSPGACTTATTITYANASFDLGPVTITGASGVVSTGGISITAGSLTPPAAWSASPFSLDDAGATLLWSGSGSSVTAVGSFTLSELFFLPLPSGWTGSTQIVLGASSSLSSLTIDADASGPGSAIASFSGSAASDGTFTLSGEAKNLVEIAGAGIDAKGTLAQSTPGGAISGSLSGSLTSPATLTTGVTIPTLTATWSVDDTPSLAVSGELALSAGGSTATLDVDLDYTDTQNWSASVKQGGSGSWKPIDGIDIPVGDITGSLANTAGALAWDLSASLDSPWSPTSVLTVTDIELSIANTCPASITALVDCGSSDAFIALTGNANVDGGSVGKFSIDADAVVELGPSAGFALAGSLSGDVTIVDGLELTEGAILAYRGLKPTFDSPTQQGASPSAFTVAAVGAMSIPQVGQIAQIQATVNDDGWVVAAYLDNITVAGDASLGTLKQGVVAYSSYATTIVNGQNSKAAPIDLKAGEMLIAATYDAPSWFLTTVGASEFLLEGTLAVDPSKGSLTATLSLETPGLTLGAKGSAVSFGIASIGFAFSTNEAGDVLLAVEGTIDMDLPTAYGSAPPTLTLSMSFSESDGAETVSATFELSDKTGWVDAFGFKGLTLDDLVISFGLEVSAVPLPLPTIALAASASLPSALRAPLSMPSDAVVSVSAELAEETPCLNLSIHAPQGSTENVLTIAGGVITAQSIDVYVAPAGCTIGTTIYAPGLALEFDGALLGDKVDVGSKLMLSPFSFDATVDIGGFQVGPLLMNESVLDVRMAAGADDSVTFAGGFDLFGTSVTASGGLSFDAGTTKGDLKIATNGFSVTGFDITDTLFSMTVTSDVESTSVDIAGSGSVSVLGSSLDVKAFDITIANNVVEKIDAEVDSTIDIATGDDSRAITIDGTFDLNYTAQPLAFDVTASATVDVGGYSLAKGNLDINTNCAALTATLDLPDVVTAALSGYIVYQAGCEIPNPKGSGTVSIAGGPGSFCGYASVSGISVGTFDAAGSVSLANNGDANCSGSGTTPDTLAGSLTADLALGAQQTKNTISVAGSFSGDGTFSLTGSGVVNVGGFDLQADVTAAKTGSGTSVSGKGSVDLLGTTVDLSGSFANVDGYPTTSMSASATTLDLGGYKPSAGSITLDQSKSAFGLSAALTLKLGVIDFSSKTTFHDTNGDIRFYASDAIDLDIPKITGVNFSAVLTNCTDSSCGASTPAVSFTGSGHFSFLQWNFASGNFDIATNGDFSVTSSSGGKLSKSLTILGCKWTVHADYTIKVTIGQKDLAPSVNTADSANAGWSNCFSSGSVGASIQLQPFKICVDLVIGRICLP